MDQVIQSQIQSPLVRSLQSIPTNSASYVHGIPDNTPPFSKQKVVVKSHIGNSKDLQGVSVFKIPQNGHLTRLVLEMRVIGHTRAGATTPTLDVDNPFSIADALEYVQLRTHNQIVETLYPSAIPFQNISLNSSEIGAYNTCITTAGFEGAEFGSGTYYEPKQFAKRLVSNNPFTSSSDNKVVDYLINLPFSTTHYFKDSLQTRLMEDLEIVVKKKTAPTQSPTFTAEVQVNPIVDTTELDLHCHYVNFHENVEEVIRNENFKPNVPATILANDQLCFKARYVPGSKVELTTGDRARFTYEVDLSCDALVTDIFIVPKVHPPNFEYERVNGFDQYGMYFRLKSEGGIITEGTKFEYDSVEALPHSTVVRQHQNDGVMPNRWMRCGTHIRLGLNNTDEFFDGGVSFQSLIAPKLEIDVYGRKSNVDSFNIDNNNAVVEEWIAQAPTAIEFDVILKRKVLLRIDGNTGKIAKSLES
jgi:hypothetical protein